MIASRVTTLNTILEELKSVPVNQLDDLHAIIRSFKLHARKTALKKKQILGFGGSFGAFSANDYNDFLDEIKRARSDLFYRDIYV